MEKKTLALPDEYTFKTESNTQIYSSQESVETTTYIAEKKLKIIGGKRKKVFSLYRVSDRRKKPVLVFRRSNKKFTSRDFETNIGESTGFRSYRKIDRQKGVDIITSDRPIYTKSARGGNYRRKPQIIGKCRVSDNLGRLPTLVVVGYSNIIPNDKPTFPNLEKAFDEVKISAIAGYITYIERQSHYDKREIMKTSRFDAVLLSWRYMYFRSQTNRGYG